jgi:hypothetical protein
VANDRNWSRTAAIEVRLPFNFAVVFDFMYFRFRPSKAKSIGIVLTNRQNAANCSSTRNLKGVFLDFLDFFMYDTQHCFICLPSDTTVSEDAGIEPRTVATTALAVRRSKKSAEELRKDIPSLRQYIDATMHPAPIGNGVQICSVYNFQILFRGFFFLFAAHRLLTQDDSLRQ